MRGQSRGLDAWAALLIGAGLAGAGLLVVDALAARDYFLWPAGLLVLAAAVVAWRALAERARRIATLERILRDTEAHFRDFSEMSADFFWVQDASYRFVARISSPSERRAYPRAQVIGRARWELPALNMTPADWTRHRAELEARREFRDLVIERPYPDGRPRVIATSGRPVFDDAGRFQGYRGVGRDITVQVLAERELRVAAERLKLAMEGSQVALWDTDLRTGAVYLDEAWSRLLGAGPGETRTSTAALLDTVHPEDAPAIRSASLAALKGERDGYALEHRVRNANGEWLWILSRGQVVERDPATGCATRMIGTNVDITRLKRDEQAARELAHRDALTGAANRALFDDRLALSLARARRAGTCVALLYIDVDRFKSINDSLGHAAGDELLRQFAARLRQCVRGSDTVARLGGDEFAVLLEDVQNVRNAAQIAEKLIAAIREPMRLGATTTLVTASVGIAVEDGAAARSAGALVEAADAALYEAKRAGRDCWRAAA